MQNWHPDYRSQPKMHPQKQKMKWNAIWFIRVAKIHLIATALGWSFIVVDSLLSRELCDCKAAQHFICPDNQHPCATCPSRIRKANPLTLLLCLLNVNISAFSYFFPPKGFEKKLSANSAEHELRARFLPFLSDNLAILSLAHFPMLKTKKAWSIPIWM